MRRVAVAVVLGTLVLGCSSSSKKNNNTSSSASAEVSALDTRQFSPGTVTVSVGGTVKWSNNGQLPHTVTFDNGPAFSQDLSSGNTVSRTFTSAGSFNYHCSIHGPSMHGTVIVR